MIISSSFKGPFTISKPLQSVDCFSHILSTFQFVLNHRFSYTHTSDLHGIICVAVRACVCENVLCGFLKWCVRLLNQYLQHPFQTAGSLSILRPLFISLSPQPSQNACIDAPSLAAFPREKGVTAATPTGVTEHPAPCQPTLAAESKAKSLAHTTADCKSVLEFFNFISGDGEPVSQCVQCVYIYMFLIILFMSLLVSCAPRCMCVCVCGWWHWSPPWLQEYH